MLLWRRDEPGDANATPDGRSSERQLWCAVIGRALEDAIGNVGGVTGVIARERAVQEARHWFFQNGEDFRMVCDSAGYDPDLLRRRVLSIISKPMTVANGVVVTFEKPAEKTAETAAGRR